MSNAEQQAMMLVVVQAQSASEHARKQVELARELAVAATQEADDRVAEFERRAFQVCVVIFGI
eukprot:SAG11_NODE_20184_length_451_cov_0.565341_1_plen_63_part_00